MSDDELKPCPFCEKPPDFNEIRSIITSHAMISLYDGKYGTTKYEIKCTSYKCYVQPKVWDFESIKDCLFKWNRRVKC